MNKVLCFGELLLRFSPVLDADWLSQNEMPFSLGGAELNVATALASWSTPVKYLTALPNNYLSRAICSGLEQKNIDTKPVQFSGSRIGLYFLPQGADLKHEGVIYDRQHSSFSSLNINTIPWDDLLADASWLHLSAISPALNEDVAAVCLDAVKKASALNVPVSIDLNYRAKLWMGERTPYEVISKLAPYCDVIMGNLWSASLMLKIPMDPVVEADTFDYLEASTRMSALIRQQYPKCKTVGLTFRFDHGTNGSRYFGFLHHEDNAVYSREHLSDKIVDKAGSGDCFMAGLIYGAMNRMSPQDTVNFATAAAFGKLHEKGDVTGQTVAAIRNRIIENG